GIRVLVGERVSEARRRIDLAELAAETEGIALGWLHLDPVGPADARVEFEGPHGEALRPEPFRQLARVAEGGEHDRRHGGQIARHLEGQLARLRRHPATLLRRDGRLRQGTGVEQAGGGASAEPPVWLASWTNVFSSASCCLVLPP